MLSVAAPQLRSTRLALIAVALSVPGAEGGVVSGAGGCDRGCHVGLDLGLGEGGVVDADVVDQAAEVLAVDRVAADRERVGGAGDRAGLGLAGRPVCR